MNNDAFVRLPVGGVFVPAPQPNKNIPLSKQNPHQQSDGSDGQYTPRPDTQKLHTYVYVPSEPEVVAVPLGVQIQQPVIKRGQNSRPSTSTVVVEQPRENQQFHAPYVVVPQPGQDLESPVFVPRPRSNFIRELTWLRFSKNGVRGVGMLSTAFLIIGLLLALFYLRTVPRR